MWGQASSVMQCQSYALPERQWIAPAGPAAAATPRPRSWGGAVLAQESPAISYSAGTSACEKAAQWQSALALLSEMREAKLEPDVLIYSVRISACEKGEQWQQALALLSEEW
ncbi:unnamed protein product [Prorocentrum cordatum]|uniref:Pentatricopeptide repeat-containing protein, chloroplastic n=1 Tax=Prorocentrum cordatum TaxID=2364126 RepID=A0ABN9V0P9_9DINO|nr:unnamed protein product [Polarella glacialis]